MKAPTSQRRARRNASLEAKKSKSRAAQKPSVTGRAENEEQLVFQAELLANMSHAVLATDTQFRITYWNAAAESLYGYSAKEVRGQLAGRVVRSTVTPEQRAAWIRDLEANVRVQFEAVHHDRAGKSLLIQSTCRVLRASNGRALGYVWVNRNITEQRRDEEQLRQQAELLELTHDAILVRDLESRITFWNRGAESLYGWTRAEAVGQPLQALLRTRFARPLAEIEAEVKRTGRWEGELVHTTRQGRPIQVASRWSLQRDSQGQPIAILEINTDITERKQSEAEIRRFNTELGLRVRERTAELEAANEKLREEIAERKRIEDELREAEQQANDLIQYAPTAIYDVDLQAARLTRVNDAMCQMTGYSREELLTMHPYTLLNPEALAVVRDRVRRIHAGEKPSEIVEYAIRTKDGRELYVLLKTQLIYERGTPVRAFVIAHDITERTRMEEALAQSEARFKSLYQSLPYLALVFQKRDDELVMIAYNRAAVPFTRGGIEAMVGRTARELYTGRPEILENVERAYAEQTMLKVEGPYRVITTGDEKYIIETFQYVPPDLLLIHVEDITDRKRAEEALRESDERFRTVLENSYDAAYRRNLQTDRNDYLSPVIERITGFSPQELRELSLEETLERFHPDDRARIRQAIEQTLTGELSTAAVEYRYLCKDGQYRWLSDHFSVVYDASGHPKYRVGSIRDVTEHRQADERLAAVNRELQRQSAELAATNKELESFSYSVSHDLRTPLATVDGLSRLLQEQYGDALPEPAQRYLALVRTGTQQMNELISSLLGLSRLSRQPLQKQPVNMTALVGEALATLQEEAARPGLTIALQELPDAEADPVLLKQVWVNLLANACKFTRKRKHARIEVGSGLWAVESADEPMATDLAVVDRPPLTAYCVRDNGIGFDMGEAGRLFEVFHRLHGEEEYEGTGVGLATVARIVHRHGGRVWASAKVGEGASFYFTLT